MSDAPPAESPRATWVRYVVLAWLCLAAMLAYITRNSIGVAEETIRDSLGFDKQDMGHALGAFFWAYAFLQVPTGWLSHVWGSRVALPVFSLLGSVTTGTFAAATGFWSIWVSRFGMGAAQAGLFPAATNTLARWFPPTWRGMASGILTCCMSVGGVIGSIITGELLQRDVPWQVIFYSFTVPTLVWAVWFYVWFRERPEEHPSVNLAELTFIREGRVEKLSEAPEPTPWLAILTSGAMFWISAQQFFRAAAYIFFTTWFATYLKETRDVGERLAGYLTSFPIAGVVVGSFLGGMLSDWLLVRTGSRRVGRQALAASTHVLSGLLILAAYGIPDPWVAVAILSVSAMVGGIGGPCAYAITMDMGGRHVPTVFSIMNMAGNFGAAVFPVVVPWVLGKENDWDRVMLSFAGIYFLAAVCWIPFDANGTIVKEPAEPSTTSQGE